MIDHNYNPMRMLAKALGLASFAASAAWEGGRTKDMELRGGSVEEDLRALEAAASKNTHIVAVACRLETSEAAVDAFLGHHLDWRWDVGAVYQRDGPCPRVELRIQPPKLAAVLRRFWQQQFNGTCDRVVVVSRHSGTYLGNRMFSMARAFIHTAMKHKLPYRFEGVPNFLLDDAACGPGGHQNAFYKDMECFWLPQTSCARPRVGPDNALGEGECARAAPGPWDWRKETNWTCEHYYVDPSAKRRGVRRFPRTLNPGHGEAHFMIAFAAIAMRPNLKTRMELRRRAAAWLRDHPSWRDTVDSGTCAVVHVRHGDKYTKAFLPAEEGHNHHFPPNATFDEYVGWAKFHLGAVAGQNFSETVPMMLMTDDADVEARAAAVGAAHGVELLTVAPGRPLVSTTAVVANEELAKVDCERQYHKPICKTGGFNYRWDPVTGEPVGSEELYQFLLAWHLVAHCKLAVGMGARSYFSTMIYAMMCAIAGKCPASVDIHEPEAPDDDGLWHYVDKRTDRKPPVEKWLTQVLPETFYQA